MACNSIQFSIHGLIKLTGRKIEAEDAIDVIQNGVIIFEYPKDRPYPSRLMIGWIDIKGYRKALHVEVAEDINTKKCIVVTSY